MLITGNVGDWSPATSPDRARVVFTYGDACCAGKACVALYVSVVGIIFYMMLNHITEGVKLPLERHQLPNWAALAAHRH